MCLQFAPPDKGRISSFHVGRQPDQIEPGEAWNVARLIQHAELRAPTLENVYFCRADREPVCRDGSDREGIVHCLRQRFAGWLCLRPRPEAPAYDRHDRFLDRGQVGACTAYTVELSPNIRRPKLRSFALAACQIDLALRHLKIRRA